MTLAVRASIAGLLAAGVVTSASSAMMTVSSGDFFFAAPVDGQAIYLQGFDPALGMLQKVDFTLTGNLLSTLTVTPASELATYGVSWTKTRFDFSIEGFGLRASNRQTDFSQGGTGLSGNAVYSGGISANQASSVRTDLDRFTGTGLYAFVANAVSVDNVSFSGLGNGSLALDTALTGRLTVVYTYAAPAAVPLPAALPLMAAGMAVLGLGSLRRRRRPRPARSLVAAD